MQETITERTCKEAGWRPSRYLIYAQIPDRESYVMMNLYQGSFVVLSKEEAWLLSIVEELAEDHPALEKLKKYGLIVNFDEREALNVAGRMSFGTTNSIGLTICPTMGCNFDCPYCFENHRPGRMSPETQEEVISLAERMMTFFGAHNMTVMWFGGEPLLAPDVIEKMTARLKALTEARGGEYRAKIITNGYFLNEENIAMLKRCDIDMAQVTLDGLGEQHDHTRHLAGGGGTFDRIAFNLKNHKIPIKVSIRHNVYADNLSQIEPLKKFVEETARESGNHLKYYSALVSGSAVMEERGNLVDRLGDEAGIREISMRLEAERYGAKPGSYCTANHLYSVGVDDQGRLFMCWEDVDKPEKSFGQAGTWDPKDPIRTAENPDRLSSYLNTCCPSVAGKCRECLWLPMCCGGCPKRVLEGEDVCYPFKDDPQAFALAVYKSLGEKNREKKEADGPLC